MMNDHELDISVPSTLSQDEKDKLLCNYVETKDKPKPKPKGNDNTYGELFE